ncbi:hypothetical protein B0H14DRAFT_1275146 [Mycena olivaceomarginata]|nr:hypothetical protein B0H14DRAFT_1275146 [Mycena olivaceomarginata]
MPFRTSTPPTPHPCLTPTDGQLRGCGRRLLPTRETTRSTGVGRRSACRKRSPASPFLPSSLLCPVFAIYWRRGLRRKLSKKAEVSRRAGIDTPGLADHVGAEGAVERGQQKAGTTACAFRPAMPPRRVSRSYPPTYSPGLLSLPIVPSPIPIPTPESRDQHHTARGSVRV